MMMPIRNGKLQSFDSRDVYARNYSQGLKDLEGQIHRADVYSINSNFNNLIAEAPNSTTKVRLRLSRDNIVYALKNQKCMVAVDELRKLKNIYVA